MNHMEQKMNDNLDLEIILILLKKETHLREIARLLGKPHSSILRKINKLICENVLDFRIEGKNKIFLIKKNLISMNYIFNAERYKLNKLLRKYPKLERIFERILEKSRNNLIVVFGSYAKFSAKENSDIDIYIETEDRKIKKELELIHTRLSIKIGKFDLSSMLIKEIIKNHVILKGVEEFYDKIF